jgi:hypothetical protein
MRRKFSVAMRQKIQGRANKRCEYCKKPDSVNLYSHHIDHIIPIIHGGTDDEGNLAWACFQCNSTKSGQIASYDFETGELTPLFHPRKDFWIDHFELKLGEIIGKTSIGRVTVRILQINHPDNVETRLFLIESGKW